MSDQAPVPLDPVEAALARTPARVLAGRCGPAYRTATLLKLREDHAAARDAVHAEVDIARDLGADLVSRFQLFAVQTQAASKAEYLRRPDLGRKLSEGARDLIRAQCPAGCDVQVVIGDGLSATAVAAQVPALVGLLQDGTVARGWSFGRPFFVRHCRVGVMNDVGALLSPEVVVLLVGERPGLATAESLSAYLAFRPRPGHTDADRNLISNIHGRGISPSEAAARVLALVEQFRAAGRSGVGITEAVIPQLGG